MIHTSPTPHQSLMRQPWVFSIMGDLHPFPLHNWIPLYRELFLSSLPGKLLLMLQNPGLKSLPL